MKMNEENCEQKSCNLLRLHLLLKQKRKDFFTINYLSSMSESCHAYMNK